jgi:hypothetical protein
LVCLIVIGLALVLPSCARHGVDREVSATATATSLLTSTTSTTTTIVAEAACRRETATGTDAAGVTHSGETICTWGPGLRAHVDSRGLVDGAQNHPVDLTMAERCWAEGGRVYLRSPAVLGWGCFRQP